jgi:hypothetical protein
MMNTRPRLLRRRKAAPSSRLRRCADNFNDHIEVLKKLVQEGHAENITRSLFLSFRIRFSTFMGGGKLRMYANLLTLQYFSIAGMWCPTTTSTMDKSANAEMERHRPLYICIPKFTRSIKWPDFYYTPFVPLKDSTPYTPIQIAR